RSAARSPDATTPLRDATAGTEVDRHDWIRSPAQGGVGRALRPPGAGRRGRRAGRADRRGPHRAGPPPAGGALTDRRTPAHWPGHPSRAGSPVYRAVPLPHRERTPLSPLREASVGPPLWAAIAATILLVAAPARYQGIDVSAIGWIVLAWSIVWLVGEVIANGTARHRSGGNLIFREANMRSPSLLGAIGTILLVVAPDQVGQVPVSTIGWVISLGAVVWLVVEAVAN